MKVLGEGFCALSHRVRSLLSLAQSGNQTTASSSSSSSLASVGLLLPAEAERWRRQNEMSEADRVEALSRWLFRSDRVMPGVRGGEMRKAPFGYEEASALKLEIGFGLLHERDTAPRLAVDSAETLNHNARTLERWRKVSCGRQRNEAEPKTYNEEPIDRSGDASSTSQVQFNLAEDLHFLFSFKQGVCAAGLSFSSSSSSASSPVSLQQKIAQKKDTNWKFKQTARTDLRETLSEDGLGFLSALVLWPGCQVLPPEPPVCLSAVRQSHDCATETEEKDNHIRSSCLSELRCIPSAKERLAEFVRSSSLSGLSRAVSTWAERLEPERHTATDWRPRLPSARLLSHPQASKSELEKRIRTVTYLPASTCLRLVAAAAAREAHCCVHDKHGVKDEMEQLGRRRHGEEGMQCRWRPKKSYKRAVFGLASTKARRRWAASRR